ncbi:hypothetical protein WMY93_026682 [Mugilogobius chulae]|uniref:Uncharacterized protein n=1 Tax=Mugilogobius chulae TaxID=88201 RepID=A0AAW0N333_9GOBI
MHRFNQISPAVSEGNARNRGLHFSTCTPSRYIWGTTRLEPYSHPTSTSGRSNAISPSMTSDLTPSHFLLPVRCQATSASFDARLTPPSTLTTLDFAALRSCMVQKEQVDMC